MEGAAKARQPGKAVEPTAGFDRQTLTSKANTKHLLRPTLQNLISSSSSTTTTTTTSSLTTFGLSLPSSVTTLGGQGCHRQHSRSVTPLKAVAVTAATQVQPLQIRPAISHLQPTLHSFPGFSFHASLYHLHLQSSASSPCTPFAPSRVRWGCFVAKKPR